MPDTYPPVPKGATGHQRGPGYATTASAGLTLLLVVTAGIYLCWSSDSSWMQAFELTLSAVVLLGAVASAVIAPTRAVRPRVLVAVGLLAVGEAVIVARLAGQQPFIFDVLPDPRYTMFLAAMVCLTIIGLLARWLWARWLAIGLGAGGALSAGLNALWWLQTAGGQMWVYLVGFFCALLILINITAPPVRAAFEQRGGQLWRSRDRLVRVIRWTVLADMLAIPMLLLYAWVQPVVPETRTTALALAVVLVIGTVLTVARKVAGALALTVGGLGLLVQTLFTVYLGHAADPDTWLIASYYVAFWLPAAVLSVVCGGMLFFPTLELLRRG